MSNVAGAEGDTRTLTAGPADAGSRLDRWLSERITDQSRARLQGLIESGHVLVDGQAARASKRLHAGMLVRVTIPPPVEAAPPAEDIPITIVYQDAHLLVVDKPAGLVVHPGAGRQTGTLVNALLHHVRDLSGVGGVLRPGIVHRLDKGTSGLLVIAKDDGAHRALARQFAERCVEKEYLAIVLGVPTPRRGTVEAPIGRHPVQRKRMSVRAQGGRAARSAYEVVEAFDGAALVRVRIHTGRTHQIRVHLASKGHPVVGDKTYGGGRAAPARRSASRDALSRLGRPALHAAQLAFQHPASGSKVSFESPLPADLEKLLQALRS